MGAMVITTLSTRCSLPMAGPEAKPVVPFRSKPLKNEDMTVAPPYANRRFRQRRLKMQSMRWRVLDVVALINSLASVTVGRITSAPDPMPEMQSSPVSR